MKVTFVQTSDPIFYLPLLEQTSKAVRCYCLKNGFSYESYIGIKRGVMPWNAAYNRIIILKELLDRQTEGWVFYLDADAYVHDMDFDLLSYLIDKDRYGAIFAGYINNVVYDINSGGFAINFSHPAGKGLVYDYYNLFRSISDEQFNSAAIWNSGEIGDDQHLLYTVLKRYFDTTKIHENFLFEHTNQSFVNNGPFICQQLRSLHHNFDERAASIGKNVLALLPQDKDVRKWGGQEFICLHPILDSYPEPAGKSPTE